jgi:hypothetical protein
MRRRNFRAPSHLSLIDGHLPRASETQGVARIKIHPGKLEEFKRLAADRWS